MTTLQQIDLADHDAFKDRVPYEWFKTLRDEDPVHWNDEPDGTGFYAVTRYHDIREVHRHTEIYSSEIGGTSLEDLEPDQIEARKSMIDMDPPRHDELRGLIARRFTPRAVQVWEEAVRTVTDRVLDLALEQEEFDFVHAISSEIPMQVFAEILGVPAGRAALHHRARRPPARQPGPGVRAADRRQPPPAAVLLARRARDVRVRPQAGRGAAQAAGRRHHHPARVRAAHAARVRRLLRAAGHRRQRDDAPHDHARPAGAARAPGPAAAAARGPRRSTSPRPRRCCAGRRPCTTSAARRRRRPSWPGVELPAGAKVTTWFVSGNRDETVFEDPDTFDVGRTPNKHMAFGPGGIHHCMGAHLARLEIKIAFEELLKRVASDRAGG